MKTLPTIPTLRLVVRDFLCKTLPTLPTIRQREGYGRVESQTLPLVKHGQAITSNCNGRVGRVFAYCSVRAVSSNRRDLYKGNPREESFRNRGQTLPTLQNPPAASVRP
jgi:hypothetical protein